MVDTEWSTLYSQALQYAEAFPEDQAIEFMPSAVYWKGPRKENRNTPES